MFLHDLEIKQFRCFKNETFTFNKQITLITGDNGVGKTSLAEAIHYLCYIKSFRTSTASDLANYESDSFFIKGSFTKHTSPDFMQSIQVGCNGRKKLIKVDNKSISTFKDIFQFFQVITLLEDDIELIKGYPSGRRSFVDSACLFLEPSYIDLYKDFKKILQSRNALLHKQSIDVTEFEIWTEKLWQSSVQIQQCRIRVLEKVQVVVNDLIKQYFDDIYQVEITYESKHVQAEEKFEDFYKRMAYIFRQEQAMKRSLFGAHLDDFSIHIKGKKARNYASRGQQKLISLLCKLSLISLAKERDFLPILIVDDFIADFDEKRLQNIINFFISCKNQIIITTPFYDLGLQKIIGKADPDVISM